MFVNFSVMPLRVSTITGFALSLCGLLGVIGVVADALLFSTPAGWASISAAVLLLSGVQLLILGLIGEYLGRLYLTANRKPQSIIRTVEHNDIAEPAAETRAPFAARHG
jgi:undecaprenyl-phosphate 4-deoxy-4-formamido-L-arabinose transferase